MKRLTAILLAAAILILSLSLPVLANKTDYMAADFTDIGTEEGSKHWAYDEMKHLIGMGIIKGYDGGNAFNQSYNQVMPVRLAKPNQNITRAEFAAILYQTLNLPVGNNAARFNDQVPAWAQEAVNSLVNAGIIKGDNYGNFRPNSFVSRAEAVTMLVQALNDKSGQTGGYFPDLPSADSHWAYQFIEKASAMGIVKGAEDGRFHADWAVQRSEVMVMIYRFLVEDKSLAPADDVLLARSDGMLKATEASINGDGEVNLSGVALYVTGGQEKLLPESARQLNEIKKSVGLSYKVTYPGRVVSKSDRWAEVIYETTVSVSASGTEQNTEFKEHYYLMKIGADWYVYGDKYEQIPQA